MKIVFMGTPDFAVPTLQALIREGHEVVAVVTNEDKPKNRGFEMQMPPVKTCAIGHGIFVMQPAKIKKNVEFIHTLESFHADVFVIVAYGKILPVSVLNIPRFGCINVHGSLLPKYRGAAPIQWSIINGEKVVGVTTMQMDEGMDTGDILLKKEMTVLETDTAGVMHDKLSHVGAMLLIETLKGIEEGTIQPMKQDEAEASYTRMLEKKDGMIDWSKTSEKIFCFVRGMTPWPSAFTYLKDQTMKVFETKIENGTFNGICGQIIEISEEKGILVKTGDGALWVTKLQMQNKKQMDATEYLRGNKVEIGEILKCELK